MIRIRDLVSFYGDLMTQQLQPFWPQSDKSREREGSALAVVKKPPSL
jgi:hypothetical protein